MKYYRWETTSKEIKEVEAVEIEPGIVSWHNKSYALMSTFGGFHESLEDAVQTKHASLEYTLLSYRARAKTLREEKKEFEAKYPDILADIGGADAV